MNCRVCQKLPAIFNWQPYGPELSETGSFFPLDRSYKKYPNIKVCGVCRSTIEERNEPVRFFYRRRDWCWAPKPMIIEAIRNMRGDEVIRVADAHCICQYIGIELNESLIWNWSGRQQAIDLYHFVPQSHLCGKGVPVFEFSNFLVFELGLEVPGPGCRGRMRRTAANVQAIMTYLEEHLAVSVA